MAVESLRLLLVSIIIYGSCLIGSAQAPESINSFRFEHKYTHFLSLSPYWERNADGLIFVFRQADVDVYVNGALFGTYPYIYEKKNIRFQDGTEGYFRVNRQALGGSSCFWKSLPGR
jgi:hypothetical protein